MRTTLTLEKDVFTRLQAEVRRTGRPFKDVVNECLRAGLAQRQTRLVTGRFEVRPRDFGGLRPGLSLDNVAELLEQVDGPGWR